MQSNTWSWIGGAVGSLTAFLSVMPLSAAVPNDEWPQYGHDAALTGRTTLKSDITKPHVAWSYAAAGSNLLIELSPEAGEFRVDLPSPPTAAAKPAPAASRETFHERWADILPDVPGPERVAWDHTFTAEQVCRLQCFANDGKEPRLIWQTDPPEGNIFTPLDIVYDIDGDGVKEILVAAHYRIMIFEGTTGRKETELQYHHSRPYGWFGLANVDGDGAMELITIGDFQSHIDVLEYDPHKKEAERLSVKWRRDIEQDIAKRSKWPQIGPHPVIDVTGDGRPEIVLNLFNDTGDNQWHAMVLDAIDGKTVADFPKRYLQGTGNVDDQPGAELFLAEADGAYVHRFGHIELISMAGGPPSVSSVAIICLPPTPSTRSTAARPSSWPGSCPSSERLPRSWPVPQR